MSNKIWVLTYTIGTNEGRKSRRLICDTKEQAIMQQRVLGGEVVEYIRQPESFWVNWPEKIDIDEELDKEKQSIAELESRTVKLPDGWQFEECEIEGCENGAIFSVGTGSRNIHLCDKCAHEPQNSRLKKSPLSKRLPFKMSAGIKVEAE